MAREILRYFFPLTCTHGYVEHLRGLFNELGTGLNLGGDSIPSTNAQESADLNSEPPSKIQQRYYFA